MIEKHREMQEHRDLWSFAVSREMAEVRDREIKKEIRVKAELAGEEKGFEMGIEKGIEKGVEIGKYDLLGQQIHKKYAKDAGNWLQTLSQYQLDRIAEMIFDYDSFEELKTVINRRK